MKRSILHFNLVLMVVFIVAAVATTAVAQPKRGGGPRGEQGGHPMLGFMARHLELTDEQKAEVKKIVDAERTVMQPIADQLKQNRDALKEVTKNGQFNEAQVTDLANRQGGLMAQMIVSRERVKAQVYQILTPEQREKMNQFQDRMEDWGAGAMRDRSGRRGR